MSDGVKGAVAEAAKTVGEAVVKPVADEVGQVIEVGAQSVFGKIPSQQNQQQKQRQDQLKIAEAQRRINWWKQIAAQQKSSQQGQVQEKMAKSQQQTQEIKQFEIVQKKQVKDAAMDVQRSRGEIRAGKGVGG